MEIDPDDLDSTALYKILIGTVLPRPIGWASTLSKEGIANLAPFSFFTVVSRKPPMVSLTMQPRSTRNQLKDTLVNARETGEFVVNVVSLPQVNQMHLTSVDYPSDEDEFELAGLKKLPSITVRPPRVAGAPVTMECRVVSITPHGDVGDHVVIGRVTRFHLRDDLWVDRGRIDTAGLQAVGRLAAEYTLTNTVFACPMPQSETEDAIHRQWNRLDGKSKDWSPINDKSWSAAGNVKI